MCRASLARSPKGRNIMNYVNVRLPCQITFRKGRREVKGRIRRSFGEMRERDAVVKHTGRRCASSHSRHTKNRNIGASLAGNLQCFEAETAGKLDTRLSPYRLLQSTVTSFDRPHDQRVNSMQDPGATAPGSWSRYLGSCQPFRENMLPVTAKGHRADFQQQKYIDAAEVAAIKMQQVAIRS